jgi:type II secretion system protein I
MILSGLKKVNNSGIALVEVLIALSILTIVVLGIYSKVSQGALSISQTKDLTNAIIIAKSKLNEFKQNKMRGTDLNDEEVDNYPGYTYDRNIERYENDLLPKIPANIVKITVKWKQNNISKNFELSFIYATN